MSEEKPTNVVVFPGATRLDIPPDRVLQAALDSDLKEVMVIGVEQDGTLYLASSNTAKDALWLLKIAERDILDDEIV